MTDSRSSVLLDDEGNLFGLVNIVDALAVLLVLAFIIAGAALILQPDPEPPDQTSTNVTLDLGPQPQYLVSEINEGDTYSPSSNSELTITDVYLTPQGNQSRIIVRATIKGSASGDSLSYANAPPRLGRSLTVATSRYEVSGQIRAVGGNNSLTTQTTTVVLRDTLSATEVRAVTAGDEIRLGGRTVATINNLTAYASDDPTQHTVFVEAELVTYVQQDRHRFGDTQVRPGQTITLSAPAYTINGQLEQVGGGLQPTTSDVLVETTVDAETADDIAIGDVATVAGHNTATIESVTTYGTQNPDRKYVLAGLRVTTVSDGTRQRFGDTVVQRGSNITVATDDYAFSGSIDRVNSLEPRGTRGNRTVTLEMTEVRQNMAGAIDPGMTETSRGETIARVSRVETEPSVIITTGDDGSVNTADHPFLRDVTITAELQVRETTNGVKFKGESIQQGSSVVINLGMLTIEADVVSVGP